MLTKRVVLTLAVGEGLDPDIEGAVRAILGGVDKTPEFVTFKTSEGAQAFARLIAEKLGENLPAPLVPAAKFRAGVSLLPGGANYRLEGAWDSHKIEGVFGGVQIVSYWKARVLADFPEARTLVHEGLTYTHTTTRTIVADGIIGLTQRREISFTEATIWEDPEEPNEE